MVVESTELIEFPAEVEMDMVNHTEKAKKIL